MADLIGHLLLVGASGRACGAAAIQAKKACLTALHSLFLPPAPAAAAPNARPPHTPRQHRQTGAGSRTSSAPAAAEQRPARIPVIPGLTGNLLPRGIIPAYPSCPTLCCHGRPDRPSPASWHTLGISSGSATIPTADSNKRLFYNSVLLDHFASFVDGPAFLAAGQCDATVPAAGSFAGHSGPFQGIFWVLEIICRHRRFRFACKVRNQFVRSWHERRIKQRSRPP